MTLRQVLGASQQEFANMTGLAVTTIARYETSRPPQGIELSHFCQIALKEAAHSGALGNHIVAERLNQCAHIFLTAMRKDLGTRARGIPQSMEEGDAVEHLLTIMRNRHIPRVVEKYEAATREVSEACDLIGQADDSGTNIVFADRQVRSQMKKLPKAYWAKKEQK